VQIRSLGRSMMYAVVLSRSSVDHLKGLMVEEINH
jgi:hypothetical protein